MRWGIGRMSYTVDPGLYALGQPGQESRVFVTANYKMSFDSLRSALAGFDAWLLVLDTKGVNVWCAAGKGTFGTEELLFRMEATGLASLVGHREIILPQLSGPGVAAHEVRRRSGFRVIYGPIRAADLPLFLAAGVKATPPMRRKAFTTAERLVLIPIELVAAAKAGLLALVGLYFLALCLSAFAWGPALRALAVPAIAFALSLLGGTVLVPLALPWLPGRSFSLKGFLVGLFVAISLLSLGASAASGTARSCIFLSWIPATTAYLAMNFTGASTFTSLSGVKREMRCSLPLEVAGAALGLAFWCWSVWAGR